MNSSARMPTPYTSAEPRSFSAITSIVGISPSSRIRAVVCLPISRIRLTRKPASETTSSTLPNSDGCKVKNGSSIHALAPRVAVASPSVSRRSAISTP
jgi:hypothetical protein